MGLYIMKHYHFSAAETIAWLRLVRPGMVIGPQAHYLKMQEPIMWKRGKLLGTTIAAGNGTASGASSTNSSPVRTPVRSAAASASAAAADGLSSTSPHHPASLPSYANSQPNTPLTPLSPASASSSSSGRPSYSASFDTPPSMYQQKINGGHHPHHHHPYSPHAAAAAAPSSPSGSSAAAAASSAPPQTRSMSAAAAALHARASNGSGIGLSAPSALASVQSRGRSKLPARGHGTSSLAPLAHEDRDLQATKLVELKRSRASGGGAVGSSPASPSSPSAVARNPLDSKHWMTSSPQRAHQPRAPSANGLRRTSGSSAAASSTYSPAQLSSLSAASLYLSQPLSLSPLAATGKAKPTTRASSQAPPGLQFRQSKR
jgi:hypothetical protein